MNTPSVPAVRRKEDTGVTPKARTGRVVSSRFMQSAAKRGVKSRGFTGKGSSTRVTQHRPTVKASASGKSRFTAKGQQTEASVKKRSVRGARTANSYKTPYRRGGQHAAKIRKSDVASTASLQNSNLSKGQISRITSSKPGARRTPIPARGNNAYPKNERRRKFRTPSAASHSKLVPNSGMQPRAARTPASQVKHICDSGESLRDLHERLRFSQTICMQWQWSIKELEKNFEIQRTKAHNQLYAVWRAVQQTRGNISALQQKLLNTNYLHKRKSAITNQVQAFKALGYPIRTHEIEESQRSSKFPKNFACLTRALQENLGRLPVCNAGDGEMDQSRFTKQLHELGHLSSRVDKALEPQTADIERLAAAWNNLSQNANQSARLLTKECAEGLDELNRFYTRQKSHDLMSKIGEVPDPYDRFFKEPLQNAIEAISAAH